MCKIDKKTGFMFGVLILGLFCGCASCPVVNQQELPEVERMLKDRDLRIQSLESLLSEKQVQIREKDKQIEQLKEKLRSLGIF